jgi:hypothetical protein
MEDTIKKYNIFQSGAYDFYPNDKVFLNVQGQPTDESSTLRIRRFIEKQIK